MAGYIGNTPLSASAFDAFDDLSGSLDTTGSSNTYAVDPSQTFTEYTDGLALRIRANHSNTGAATLNVSGLGAKTIKKYITTGVSDVASGDILSGAIYDVTYDKVNDYFIIVGLTHAQTLLANVTKRITANMGFTPSLDSSDSGDVTFDFSDGNICKITLYENITNITLSGADEGDMCHIKINQPDSANYSVSGWPANVKWTDGQAPTITATNGVHDIVSMLYADSEYSASITQNHS